MQITNLDNLMEIIEEYAGDAKVEIHKMVPLNHEQQVNLALIFERLLDHTEEAIRDVCD